MPRKNRVENLKDDLDEIDINGNSDAEQQVDETKKFGKNLIDEIILIVVILISVVVFLGLFTNSSGFLTKIVNFLFKGLFGIAAYLVPLFSVWLSVIALKKGFNKNLVLKTVGSILMICSITIFFHTIGGHSHLSEDDSFFRVIGLMFVNGNSTNGGFIGAFLGEGFIRLFNTFFAFMISSTILVISLVILTGKSFFNFIRQMVILISSKNDNYDDEDIQYADDQNINQDVQQDIQIDNVQNINQDVEYNNAQNINQDVEYNNAQNINPNVQSYNAQNINPNVQPENIHNNIELQQIEMNPSKKKEAKKIMSKYDINLSTIGGFVEDEEVPVIEISPIKNIDKNYYNLVPAKKNHTYDFSLDGYVPEEVYDKEVYDKEVYDEKLEESLEEVVEEKDEDALENIVDKNIKDSLDEQIEEMIEGNPDKDNLEGVLNEIVQKTILNNEDDFAEREIIICDSFDKYYEEDNAGKHIKEEVSEEVKEEVKEEVIIEEPIVFGAALGNVTTSEPLIIEMVLNNNVNEEEIAMSLESSIEEKPVSYEHKLGIEEKPIVNENSINPIGEVAYKNDYLGELIKEEPSMNQGYQGEIPSANEYQPIKEEFNENSINLMGESSYNNLGELAKEEPSMNQGYQGEIPSANEYKPVKEEFNENSINLMGESSYNNLGELAKEEPSMSQGYQGEIPSANEYKPVKEETNENSINLMGKDTYKNENIGEPIQKESSINQGYQKENLINNKYQPEEPIKPMENNDNNQDNNIVVTEAEDFRQDTYKNLQKSSDIESGDQSLFKEEKYVFPPIDLLGKSTYEVSKSSKSEMLENAKKLEQTLSSFNAEAKVVQINRGPTITKYELIPNEGVKVNKIVGLSDDMALSLAAHGGIRIEAPIPGKSAVGIEVPNKERQPVFFRDIVSSEEFKNFESKLAFGVGQDISGKPVVTDIAKTPHLLIAGATGSGKSVCINTLIISILYKSTPDEVKLLLVDPKIVELSIYNGIPHLLIPVVTDPKKAAGALNWAVREMDDRYEVFAKINVRNLEGYNKYNKENGQPALPQIVIVIDELADLMIVAKADVEAAIMRLTAKARAAGIHLIIATQRPSVDVITGVIKANVPSRLAFAVSSGTDSRTIINTVGAEKLLGRGDMLFQPITENSPVRLQGAFVADKEVENIVDFIKKDSDTVYDEKMIEEITSTDKNLTSGGDDDSDEHYREAVELVAKKQKASTSMLQRSFRIGYNRAARLMEELEVNGIVGPEDGSKPRKVLVTPSEL